MQATKETIQKGLHYFQMNGSAVYSTAIQVLPKAINQVLLDTGLDINDIDYMIPPLYDYKDIHFPIAESSGSITYNFSELEPLYKTNDINIFFNS